MSAHNHRTRVPGCYRCELNEDEQGIRPMTAAEVLAAWQNAADASDRAPWEYAAETEEIISPDGGIAEMTWPGRNATNAALIVTARDALPRAVAALQAVLDLLDERDEETAEVYGESEVVASSLVTTHEVRDALNAALGVRS